MSLVRNLARVLLLAVMAAGGVARAQPAATAGGDIVAAWSDEVADREAARAPVAQRQAQLEATSRAEAAEIERLKAQPAGFGRDLRLGEALASAQQRADELSKVAATLRGRDLELAEARRQLVAACRAMVGDGRVSPVRRAEAARIQAATERALTSAAPVSSGVQVAPATGVDPLAGPVELGERADRLHDDADKLQREAARLARRIEGIEERVRLRERAAEMDDDLFVEGGVARRAQRPPSSSANRETTSAADRGNAAPAAAGGTFGGQTPGGSAGESSPPTAALRGVVDPSTLAELRRAESGGDPERALAALRRARGELLERSAELARREKQLRARAAELRKSK